MIRCVLYCRMSTNMQENSIESQQLVLQGYADKHKMNIVNEYIDEGISGRQASKRPAFMQMIEDSSKGIFDLVLIYDSSRFARNLEESIVYKSLLNKNGVSLVSVTEPTLDEDTSLVTDALFGAMNEMYSRKLSKSVKRGMQFKAQQGYPLGKLPYGYKKSESGRIPSIIPDEAAVVRLLFDLFTHSKPTYSSVAKTLNNMGYRHRDGSPWEARCIKRLLTNKMYAGYNSWQFDSPTPYKGMQEPIVDIETFDKAQQLIANIPKGQRDNSAHKHWLSGVFRCGYCGSVMVINKHPVADYLRCRKNAVGLCKPTTQISVKKAQKGVFQILEEIVNHSDHADFTHASKPRIDNTTQIEERIEKLYKKLKRYANAYSEGIDTIEEYKTNKALISLEIDNLKEEQSKTKTDQSSDMMIHCIQQPSKNIVSILTSDDVPIIEKNNAIRQVISKIVYDRTTETMTIFFNH